MGGGAARSTVLFAPWQTEPSVIVSRYKDDGQKTSNPCARLDSLCFYHDVFHFANRIGHK